MRELMSLKASEMRVIGHLLSKNVQQVGQRTFRRAVTRHTRCMSSIRAAPGEPFGEAVKRLGVKYVLFAWTDLFGVMRSKLVPAKAAAGVAQDGAGFAGFAAHLDLQPSDPDVLATPDVSSLVTLPWKREVAWVACDLSMGGKPLLQSPRDALKRVQTSLLDKCGLSIKTGVELEFHLVSSEDASRIADAADSAVKPCYQVEPLMRQYDLIAELLDYMEELGWKPYQADHEDSIGQFEINWTYDDALITADRHMLFKINSYKRINAVPTISGSSWSPNTVSWTGNNRSHMIRVPDAPRFEMRLPDSACNAYLMPAVVTAAGLDGIIKKIDPGPPLLFNMYTADKEMRVDLKKLPLNLLDALRLFKENDVLADAIGRDLATAYYNHRLQQWNEFARSMSKWEIDNTLGV